MYQPVKRYSGVIDASRGTVESDRVKHNYVIYIEYGDGESHTIATDFGGSFAAWIAALSTGRAEFDPEGKHLRVQG